MPVNSCHFKGGQQQPTTTIQLLGIGSNRGSTGGDLDTYPDAPDVWHQISPTFTYFKKTHVAYGI